MLGFARTGALTTRGTFIALLLLASLILSSTAAHALVVNGVLNTTVNPGSYAGWTQGDPGWTNVAEGRNFVYLGDRWILTARHAADPTPSNPATANFPSGSFTSVAGENYVIHNPPPALAAGLSLTTETDLRLFRINGDPGLPSLTIASQTPPLAGNNGSQVVFIGNGRVQETNQTHWNVNTSNPDNWIWSETPSGGNYHGYETTSSFAKRWGTNRLANAMSSDYDDVFSQDINSRTAVLPLETSDGNTRDVITMLSTFDQTGQNGSTTYEAQAVSSDSGGAVFYKSGSQWELLGIVNSTLLYDNQSVMNAVYGDATTFANLSYYNQAYQGSICDVMKSCGNFSILGDINVDGIVSGDGTGPWATDDVTAFVAGWAFDNGAGSGDYASWTHGDLNLDGRTDIGDFLLFRGALPGSGSSAAALSSLLGATVGVPECSTILLASVGVLVLTSSMRRRRSV